MYIKGETYSWTQHKFLKWLLKRVECKRVMKQNGVLPPRCLCCHLEIMCIETSKVNSWHLEQGHLMVKSWINVESITRDGRGVTRLTVRYPLLARLLYFTLMTNQTWEDKVIKWNLRLTRIYSTQTKHSTSYEMNVCRLNPYSIFGLRNCNTFPFSFKNWFSNYVFSHSVWLLLALCQRRKICRTVPVD